MVSLNQPGAGGAGRAMATARCRLRNEMVIGKGGKQVLVDDPSGNPAELFEQA
jgi:hypothetical protein